MTGWRRRAKKGMGAPAGDDGTGVLVKGHRGRTLRGEPVGLDFDGGVKCVSRAVRETMIQVQSVKAILAFSLSHERWAVPSNDPTADVQTPKAAWVSLGGLPRAMRVLRSIRLEWLLINAPLPDRVARREGECSRGARGDDHGRIRRVASPRS